MKILNPNFKMSNIVLEIKSKTTTYGYGSNVMDMQKIWPQMLVSNKEIRNAFIVSFVEICNKRIMQTVAD